MLLSNIKYIQLKIIFQGLQKDIEEKGKFISSLKKLCSHVKENVQAGQNTLIRWDSDHTQKVVFNLERRWHNLWLESLECHCVLEGLMKSFTTVSILEIFKFYCQF